MLNVLHSSAGAGKTHALVKRYLVLALGSERPNAYRRILALTFTNKAAAEMRERVLTYLLDLASGDHAQARTRDLLNALDGIGVPPDVVRQRANAVHAHMLHHWPDIAITTIDAFVRRVVRPFARDLRLDQDLRMSTDLAHYHAEAVDRLLARAGNAPALTELLVATCEQLLEDEKGWSPEGPFLQLGAQLGQEQAMAHLEALRGIGAATFLQVRDDLRNEVERTVGMLRDLGGEALALLEENEVRENELAHGGRGPFKFFQALAAAPIMPPELTATVRKVHASGNWSSGSASPAAKARIDAIASRLDALLDRIEEFYDRPLREHRLRLAVLRDLMPTGALHILDEQLEAAKQEDHVTFFQDLTRRVAEVVRDEPVPFIYERIGQRYRHFLIDEFQDTSVLQWWALLPLVENALGESGTVFLVGDAKQAIYRWRNGEVRQFIALPDLHDREAIYDGARREAALQAAYHPIPPLVRNYRSGRAIVRSNNALFNALRRTLPNHLQRVYEDSEQEPFTAHEGMVAFSIVPSELTGADREAFEQDRVLELVQEALIDGYRPGDIALLTRTSTQGQLIARTLTDAGHPVVSPDGLRLARDPAVNAIVDALRFLHDRSEEAAARALQGWALVHGRGPTDNDLFLGRDGYVRPSERLEELLGKAGGASAGPTLLDRAMAVVQALGLTPTRDAFIATLLDIVDACMHEHGHDIGTFLEQWERDGSKTGVALPDDGSAIQVLTIHRSKGLQFPVVIVPYTEMATRSGRHVEHIWVDPGTVVPQLPSVLVRLNKLAEQAQLPEAVEEKDLRRLDHIDMLYVAFTRPEQRLYALLRAGSHDPLVRGTIAHWNAHLATAGPDAPIGQRAVVQAGPIAPAHASPQEIPPAVIGPRKVIVRRTAPEDWDPTDPVPLVRFGKLVHAVLAQVRGVHDLVPALNAAVARGMIDPGSARTLEDLLRPVLEREEVRPYFADNAQVLTESPLITAEGHVLRPDRIVRAHQEWRVLDIKTGAPRDVHREQVRNYRELLSDIVGSDVRGALLYIRSGELMEA